MAHVSVGRAAARFTLDNVTAEDAEYAANILAVVARLHGLRVEDIKSRSRKAPIVAARRDGCRRMRLAGYSTPAIGIFIGGLNHTSVLHLLGELRGRPIRGWAEERLAKAGRRAAQLQEVG